MPSSEKTFKPNKKIVVNDKMQQDYVYELSQSYGKNLGDIMKKALKPSRMLELGVFSGKYLNDCKEEFPSEWFKRAKKKLSRQGDDNLNCFKVKSGQSLTIWREKGWVIGPDVRGWFQWWCRYYIGRRIKDVDEKQIKRWESFNRHAAQVKKSAKREGRVGDPSFRTKQRQALLQWAYDPYPDVPDEGNNELKNKCVLEKE